MVKYKLINEETHSIWYTDNEKKKAELISKGYHIYEDKAEVKAPTTKRRKAAKKNEGQIKD